MICPKCKELGQKSNVYGGSGTCTAMYCPTYYDEDGKFHNHDSNNKSFNYSCSMGHQIFVSPSNKCPNCDFGHDEVVTVKDSPVSDTLILGGSGSIIIADGTTIVPLTGTGVITTGATITKQGE